MTRISTLIRDEHLRMLEKHSPKNVRRIQESKLRESVKTELRQLVNEAAEVAPKITTELEKVRKKLVSEGVLTKEQRGGATHLRGSRPEKRIPLETVSRMIDVPVNELLLYFLNGNRITNEQTCLYEYRLGCVCFYGDESSGEVK